MALETQISLRILAQLTGTTDLAPLTAPHRKQVAYSWPSGTGANQADLVWGDNGTIAASANTDIDLTGGLTGAFGVATNFVRVKAILVTAADTNTNNVVVGGAASNAFVGPFADATDKVSLAPGGVFFQANPSSTGWAVTATTADLLRVANSGAGSSVAYSILIIGASA